MFRYQAVEMYCYKDGYTTYGILADKLEGNDWKPVAFVADVTCNKEFAIELSNKCTAGQLDPIHIYDVVTDFISQLLGIFNSWEKNMKQGGLVYDFESVQTALPLDPDKYPGNSYRDTDKLDFDGRGWYLIGVPFCPAIIQKLPTAYAVGSSLFTVQSRCGLLLEVADPCSRELCVSVFRCLFPSSQFL